MRKSTMTPCSSRSALSMVTRSCSASKARWNGTESKSSRSDMVALRVRRDSDVEDVAQTCDLEQACQSGRQDQRQVTAMVRHVGVGRDEHAQPHGVHEPDIAQVQRDLAPRRGATEDVARDSRRVEVEGTAETQNQAIVVGDERP